MNGERSPESGPSKADQIKADQAKADQAKQIAAAERAAQQPQRQAQENQQKQETEKKEAGKNKDDKRGEKQDKQDTKENQSKNDTSAIGKGNLDQPGGRSDTPGNIAALQRGGANTGDTGNDQDGGSLSDAGLTNTTNDQGIPQTSNTDNQPVAERGQRPGDVLPGNPNENNTDSLRQPGTSKDDPLTLLRLTNTTGDGQNDKLNDGSSGSVSSYLPGSPAWWIGAIFKKDQGEDPKKASDSKDVLPRSGNFFDKPDITNKENKEKQQPGEEIKDDKKDVQPSYTGDDGARNQNDTSKDKNPVKEDDAQEKAERNKTADVEKGFDFEFGRGILSAKEIDRLDRNFNETAEVGSDNTDSNSPEKSRSADGNNSTGDSDVSLKSKIKLLNRLVSGIWFLADKIAGNKDDNSIQIRSELEKNHRTILTTPIAFNVPIDQTLLSYDNPNIQGDLVYALNIRALQVMLAESGIYRDNAEIAQIYYVLKWKPWNLNSTEYQGDAVVRGKIESALEQNRDSILYFTQYGSLKALIDLALQLPLENFKLADNPIGNLFTQGMISSGDETIADETIDVQQGFIIDHGEIYMADANHLSLTKISRDQAMNTLEKKLGRNLNSFETYLFGTNKRLEGKGPIFKSEIFLITERTYVRTDFNALLYQDAVVGYYVKDRAGYLGDDIMGADTMYKIDGEIINSQKVRGPYNGVTYSEDFSPLDVVYGFSAVKSLAMLAFGKLSSKAASIAAAEAVVIEGEGKLGINAVRGSANPEVGETLVGSSRAQMRSAAERTISSDPEHPLKFLLDNEGKFHGQRGMKHYELIDHPEIVQMGHITSFKLGSPERLMIQGAWENQFNAITVEASRLGGAVLEQKAISIGNIAVDIKVAEFWEAIGWLKPGTVKSAPIVIP